ncbi:TCP-1/cpn60 chaperonin family protein [Natronorubrum texcoconense]|uniref:Chaperonin GroEL (HSP60 family) n=1 Tax=Natronorubrum texcoconense TaxID=1095776 RepID=A0A1G9CWA5_9EURY|nr:TCP-1/cpn60 chaperonin family protein [Natronorubrum texcoconense]SDK55704.1 Chaperonin GroEL (HSP60 family) [Natronorubrum texcoconense]
MPDANASAAVSWEQLSAGETRSGIQQAAREMGELVRSTLGPLGADKMIVRRMDDDRLRTFVTNNGVAILEEFEGETDHPIANRFIALAEDHEDALGDGTTTTVLLASDLLTSGVDLIEAGVPPVDVIEGFSIGAQRTLEVWDEIGIPVADADRPTTRAAFDESVLERIAHSGMTNGRLGAWPLEQFADDVVDAVFRAWEPERDRVHIGYVSIEAIPGGDASSSSVIPGTLLPDDPMVAHLLPVDGDVLLVDGSLQPREITAGSVTVSADCADGFDDRETDGERIAASIADSNCAAVFATGDVTHEIGEQLAARGVVCFRNVKDSSIDVLSRVTGATIRGPVTPGEPATPDEFGRGTVRLREAQNDKTWLEVTAPDGVDPQTVGLVVRGGTESAADEAKRRITAGLNAVRAAIKRPVALPGGGAAEVEAARAVRQLAPRFDGREQLAVEEFATVLESIPQTLARNAGHDPIDALTELRTHHDAGHTHAGIDASGRIVEDTVTASDALDAQLIRTNNLAWSVEFANSLFRVDNVVFDTSPPIDLDEIGR